MASDTPATAPGGPWNQSTDRADGTAATRAAGETAALSAPADLRAGLRPPADRRPRLLPRLEMFSDMPDRGLFVLFIFVGFLLIFGAKTALWYLGVPGDYSIEIAIGAAVVMIVYGILARRISAVRLRPDRLGDNFYYMGFIFTLASMSAALVQLQAGREVDSLIGSFGVALFSTILGIAGRVTFTQMRTEVEDIEERERKNLLEAAALLRGQLGAAARDLESFRTGVQQAVHERLSESADAFSKMTVIQVDQIKHTVASTIGSVEAAFAAHETAAASLAYLADKVSGSVDDLVRRIEAVHVPPSLLEEKIDALLHRLGQTATAFEKVAEADVERHQDLAAAGAELRRVVAQIARQLAKLQDTAQSLQASAEPAVTMAESLGHAQEALEATATAARALGTEVDGARRRMVDDIEQSRAAVVEVQKALADTARVVAEALGAPSPGARVGP